MRAGILSGRCPRIARRRLPRHRLHICDLLDEHGCLLALRLAVTVNAVKPFATVATPYSSTLTAMCPDGVFI
eukprot:3565302-Pyramimonas_sp.AAC.1